MRTRETLPEEKVKCTQCSAKPWVRCTTLYGASRRPHADRVARYNGLLPTPRAGFYVGPTRLRPIIFDEDETPGDRALQRLKQITLIERKGS